MRVRSELDQVFLRPRGATVEALVVLDAETGARTRETLVLPSRDLHDAVRMLARALVRRPGFTGARRCRLRVEHGGRLRDDLRLRDALRGAVADGLRDHDE